MHLKSSMSYIFYFITRDVMKVRGNVIMFLIAINHAINIPSIDPFASDHQPMKTSDRTFEGTCTAYLCMLVMNEVAGLSHFGKRILTVKEQS